MSKFDTHGGYFSPKDYLKVNEGGSHEENPNGGVQIGVDPEGVPNLLEEGEPVYKDYVYSDNITAEREFLEQNHLPSKYEGKLYSKIADDFVSEAETRPLDFISRNGLEVMLGRLADAQEGQKQRDQQRELEEELSTLSPEELDQFEAMLNQRENGGEPIGALGEEGTVPQQMPVQQQVTGMPVMGYGGTLLKRFDLGGDTDEPDRKAMLEAAKAEVLKSGLMTEGASDSQGLTDALQQALEANPNKSLLTLGATGALEAYNDWKEDSAAGKFIDSLVPTDATQAFGSPVMRQAGRVVGPIGRSIGRGFKRIGSAIKNAPKHLLEIEGRKTMLQEAKAVVREAKEASAAAKSAANSIAADMESVKASLKADPSNKILQQQLAELEAKSAKADVASLKASAKVVGAEAEAANKAIGAFTGGPMYNRAALEKEIDGLQKAYDSAKAAAEAAPKDKVLQETAESALKALEKARGNWNKIWRHGEWQYKVPIGGAAVGYKAADISGDKKQNWVEKQFGKGGNLFVQGGRPDKRPGHLYDAEATYMYDPSYWDNLLDTSLVVGGSDGTDTGAPLTTGVRVANSSVTGKSSSAGANWYDSIDPSLTLEPTYVYGLGPSDPGLYDIAHGPNPTGLIVKSHPITKVTSSSAEPSDVDDEVYSAYEYSPGVLPTGARYAGAIGSGLLGLYNAFQAPDKYTQRRLVPQLPMGRIHLRNQVYNPIDQNLAANAIIAQSNATNRALRNSGLGPAAAASILAADNNATTNLGTGFIQAWDANNQRKDAVIAANNQAEAQSANFDYTVDAARKQILNDIAYKEAYNDLMLQRLNYAAEGDKYTAISNQIANGLQALSGIGKENFAMNQVNTNPANLGYRVGPNGVMFYNPKTKKWELKKK